MALFPSAGVEPTAHAKNWRIFARIEHVSPTRLGTEGKEGGKTMADGKGRAVTRAVESTEGAAAEVV